MSHLSRNILLLLVVAVGGCEGRLNMPAPPPAAPLVLTANEPQTLEIVGDWNISDVAGKLGTLPMALKRLNPTASNRLVHGTKIKVLASPERIRALRPLMESRHKKQLAQRERVAKERALRSKRRAARLKRRARRARAGTKSRARR